METNTINLKNKVGFMSLLVGDEIFKLYCAHGEDCPVAVGSWIVSIEPTKAGDIPKMGIQSKDKVNEKSFFVHLIENQNVIIDDDGHVFFDFQTEGESLGIKRPN